MMKVYLMSMAAGILVGVIYSLLGVRSPAPPVIAFLGLLGMLVGEQLPPLVLQLWRNEPVALSWINQIRPHMFGHLPKGDRNPDRAKADAGSIDPGL
jgi:XapX domain-containing protein